MTSQSGEKMIIKKLSWNMRGARSIPAGEKRNSRDFQGA